MVEILCLTIEKVFHFHPCPMLFMKLLSLPLWGSQNVVWVFLSHFGCNSLLVVVLLSLQEAVNFHKVATVKQMVPNEELLTCHSVLWELPRLEMSIVQAFSSVICVLRKKRKAEEGARDLRSSHRPA